MHMSKCLITSSHVDRGRVVGGLPDVVTIMEHKVLYFNQKVKIIPGLKDYNHFCNDLSKMSHAALSINLSDFSDPEFDMYSVG